MSKSNYEKYPFVKVDESGDACEVGWENLFSTLNLAIQKLDKKKVVVGIDIYHGVDLTKLIAEVEKHLYVTMLINTNDSLKPVEVIAEMVYPVVTDDQIFGKMNDLQLLNYFDQETLKHQKDRILEREAGTILVCGEGAALFGEFDILVYADLARWEIQTRMKQNLVGNFGMKNLDESFSHKYKQAYFLDWRVMDTHKVKYFEAFDFFIDSNQSIPKMINAAAYEAGLNKSITRPFRVVPFFDPGPWGGQWIKEVMDLDKNAVNFAWGFDCVPEENSLQFKFGENIFEIPAINLVFKRPKELLGDKIYEEFGAEFPIRFDLLDTMGGGNLSLQVHPTNAYIKEQFGMAYTQDESYYYLQAESNAVAYLGTHKGVNASEMIEDLEKAQNEVVDFDVEKYVNKFPVKKHDHLLIPAGTIHCSGRDAVVLEISATPYIFTFKLWDWGRLGLDGKPRPINIEHGKKVIDWSRDEAWVSAHLVNQFKVVEQTSNMVEESTGLYQSQFIETRRHWFNDIVLHHTEHNLNVLNLVEGEEVIVESPTNAFEPYVIHYAETFIIPAHVDAYTIRPHGQSIGKQCATLKAYVR